MSVGRAEENPGAEAGLRGVARLALGIALVSGLAACSGGSQQQATRGMPSPAVAAQRAAAGDYSPPGPPGDPWGPYIREASGRFSVPEKWIREVMRQESGGQQYIGGSLTISGAGAMGLMQLMPVTYAQMRDRYGLGPDPYSPHDNIMAGTAYIGEMYARYGSPGFLAAYNAGPGRFESYLYNGTPLPSETVGYMAAIGPRLGDRAPSGPLARYAVAETSSDELNQRALNGTLQVAAATPAPVVTPAPAPMAPPRPAPVIQQVAYVPPPDPAPIKPVQVAPLPAPVQMAALPPPMPAHIQAASIQTVSYQPAPSYDPGAIGDLNQQLAAKRARGPIESPLAAYAPQPAAARIPMPEEKPHLLLASTGKAPAGGGWIVQVGAFGSPIQAEAAANEAKSHAHGALDRAHPAVATVTRPHAATMYRAQLTGLSADAANDACSRLGREHVACIVVAPHGEI
ncbi:MAG TPA: transglycosylase SLT domain-containing protein [Aliidongia sp.]|nr:transglycosylase SLT domain-containing protein [Aliidongia sp.]